MFTCPKPKYEPIEIEKKDIEVFCNEDSMRVLQSDLMKSLELVYRIVHTCNPPFKRIMLHKV